MLPERVKLYTISYITITHGYKHVMTRKYINCRVLKQLRSLAFINPATEAATFYRYA